MEVLTEGQRVDIAQREAFDRILQNHELYCTVCDNNNQNCTVHNTTADLDVKHQARPYRAEAVCDRTISNPFYRYDPDQCILCGRCVESCQNVQVNETLSINWESRPSARVCGMAARRSRARAASAAGTASRYVPCNALMEKSMLGHAGYLTEPAREGARTT